MSVNDGPRTMFTEIHQYTQLSRPLIVYFSEFHRRTFNLYHHKGVNTYQKH